MIGLRHTDRKTDLEMCWVATWFETRSWWTKWAIPPLLAGVPGSGHYIFSMVEWLVG